MKCVIPSLNVKILARAVQSLAKIGDEMFIQPSSDDLILRTINMAKSAFAEFRMCKTFFSYFCYNDPQDVESKCKVTMKSFLSVFKGAHNLDKQVENCEVRLRPDSSLVVVQIKFSNASTKKYYLPIIESDQLEAQIPSDAPNQLAASSKFLSTSLKNFRHSEDEITLVVSPDKTIIKNHLELRRDLTLMRTELCFHQNEFESYVVGNPTNVTFCLKELRSVVNFAEPTNLPVIISFSQPGRPIVFQVINHPAYEANYVVSTLNSETECSRISVTRTTHSPQVTLRPSETSNIQDRHDPYTFNSVIEEVPDATRKRLPSTEEIAITANPCSDLLEKPNKFDSNNGDMNPNSSQKRKLLSPCEPTPAKRRNTSSFDPEEVPCITEIVPNITNDNFKHSLGSKLITSLEVDLEKTKERVGNGNDSLVVPESEPTDSFHVSPGPSTAPDGLLFKIPSSRTSSESSQPPPELLKTIFSRCFSKDHFLDALVGHDVILEESSDREIT